MTAKTEQKSFAIADETREFERGPLELLRIGGAEIGRLTLQRLLRRRPGQVLPGRVPAEGATTST